MKADQMQPRTGNQPGESLHEFQPEDVGWLILNYRKSSNEILTIRIEFGACERQPC